jgi:hypothetical protein
MTGHPAKEINYLKNTRSKNTPSIRPIKTYFVDTPDDSITKRGKQGPSYVEKPPNYFQILRN